MDVVNIGHTRFDNYVIVQLNGLELRHQRHFLKRRETYEMFRGLKLGFQARAHVKRYKTSDDFLSLHNKGEMLNLELVLRLSEYNNHLNRVGVDLPDEIVTFPQKSLPPSF